MNSSVHLFLLTFFTALQAGTWSSHAAHSPSPEEFLVGFRAAPDSAVSSFQPLLSDSSGNYSLGFLRVNPNQLTLSVLHVPSSVPLWSANTTRLAIWADSTQLFFNGSLVLSDARTGVFWSTATTGDRVWLSNTSNLMIQKLDGVTILWQSFDFPSDTLVENQNFTSTMTLVSSNGLYSMRLGPDYIGLYAKFAGSGMGPDQMYLKHRALEAKAEIVEGSLYTWCSNLVDIWACSKTGRSQLMCSLSTLFSKTYRVSAGSGSNLMETSKDTTGPGRVGYWIIRQYRILVNYPVLAAPTVYANPARDAPA
ncbi:UNVERIFIED_CONTAM: PAN domain-containing protein [Sesamum angustifolium]|uniref:PAN domain-containing protein n=1 Tax=Sesamum angustifolium TaxID=2727405 RepID=A0AAW2N532_9LAMI